MTYDPNKHHRRSIRLKGYDYTRAGAYFITICTRDRLCLFGDVVDGEMRLNDAGRMIQTVWQEIPQYYPGVEIDAFSVMPNHFHGIVILVGAAPRGRPVLNRECGQPRNTARIMGQPQGVAPTDIQHHKHARRNTPTTLSLPDVVHRFKTMTTKRYVDGVKTAGWTPFHGRLWQRNYYEHIIRNDESLNHIREYILYNPLQWTMDRNNPAQVIMQTNGRLSQQGEP